LARGLVLLAGCGVVLAGLVVYRVAVGVRPYTATGDSYPGILTSTAEAVGYFAAAVSGAVCLGALVYIILTARPDQSGKIDPCTFRVHLVAERVALGWLVFAAGMVAVQAGSDSGIAVGRLVSSPVIGDAIAASEMSRGWIAVAACAAVVAVVLRLTVRWVWHCVLLVPALIGAVAVPVSGNAGQGPNHDYATSAVIVFTVAVGVLVGVKVAAIGGRPEAALSRRVTVVQVACGTAAVTYGAILLGCLLGPGALTGTDYGRLVIIAAVLLGAVWLADILALVKPHTMPLRRKAGTAEISALATIAAIGAIAAMAIQTAPKLLAHQFSVWDVLLGYELPGPPNAVRLLTVWRFDVLIGTGAVVLAGAYLMGFVRLRRRGDGWPAGRLVAWSAGCGTLLITSSSGVKAYGSAMFSVHMAEHMALNMFIPVLLVLGAPVTLALRSLPAARDGQPPGPREWLVWLVHSPVMRFIAHPVTAFLLYVTSLYAVYFTPLFDTLVRYHWGHELMSIHFLVTGYLFFWGIIGPDPGPRRLPFVGRLGLLFASMPFHAFFGIATMTMTSTIGGNFYRSLALPWVASINADQHLGGAIAWASSELPGIIVVVALVAQWAQQDRRAGARQDRHTDTGYDDELEAYNAMLRELSRAQR
jgi:cytochrome c oxidase assembly factor CtaG